MNWEFTGETRIDPGTTTVLRRIRATRTFIIKCGQYGKKVLKGDLGGWIEKESNLAGKAWVADSARVMGNAIVTDHAWIRDDAIVYDNALVCGRATVGCRAFISGNAKISDNALVVGGWVQDAATVSGNARIEDCARVYGNARVEGAATLCGEVIVRDYALVSGTASLHGCTVISGNARVYNDSDYIVFKDSWTWTNGSWFTYTFSNQLWTEDDYFHGTGEALIARGYTRNELSGKCYEAIVNAVKLIETAKTEAVKTEVGNH